MDYKIEEIYGDGYERWAKIEISNSKRKIWVHFVEYDEYLDSDNYLSKRKKGDILSGQIKISLVDSYEDKNKDEQGFFQPINKSSTVIAIGKVVESNGTDIVVCKIDGLGDNIIIEFEYDLVIEINTNIKVQGALEIELK